MADRRKLPVTRPATVRKVEACGFDMYVCVGFYPDSPDPGEVFVTIAKSGSTVAGFVNAWATTVSIAFQHGVPWEVLREKYLHHRFDPSSAECPSLLHAMTLAIDGMISDAKNWELKRRNGDGEPHPPAARRD